MERNIVLGHELKIFNLFRILPPFLPLICVACRDGQIAVCVVVVWVSLVHVCVYLCVFVRLVHVCVNFN